MTAVAGLDLAVGGTGLVGPDGRSWYIAEKPGLGPYERTSRIARRVARLLELELLPELVVLEGYGAAGSRSSMIRGIEIGGIVRVDLHRAGTPWLEVAPPTLKAYATGHGHADKAAMLDDLEERLSLSTVGLTDDEADAAWLRDVGLWLCRDDRAAGPHPETSTKVRLGLLERSRTVLMAARLPTREDP